MAKWVDAIMVDSVQGDHLYDCKRARYARLAVAIGRIYVKAVIVALSIVGLGTGATLVMVGQGFGWFVASLGLTACLPLVWYVKYLSRLPYDATQGLGGRIEQNLLARIKPHTTAADLAGAVMALHGGQFMAARLGIGPSFLGMIASHDSASVDDVWNAAATVADKRLDSTGVITAADVTAAIARMSPLSATLLPQLQLSIDDVDAGADWYAHLQFLIDRSRLRRKTGGIARDWTFGYTPMLERYARNVTTRALNGAGLHAPLRSHIDTLQRLQSVFSGNGRQSVALVGPMGAGKTTVIDALAAQFMENDDLPRSVRFRQVVSLDAATLISRASGRGELEGLVNALLIEAYRAKNIIVVLDDAQLFFSEGVGSVDIGAILEPVIVGGGLPMIICLDEQNWLAISRRYPTLSASLNRINIAPATPAETVGVLQDQAVIVEFAHKVTFMLQSLREVIALSDRYVHDQALPGKAVRLLDASADFAEAGVVTVGSVKTAVEKTFDVRVSGTANAGEKKSLLNLEETLHKRMVAQDRAVHVVSDALRRSSAGIRNQQRPAGTFLFLGPTGVGKTELAKALADVYFGGEETLIRVDMNQLVGPTDVDKLLADAATDSHSLVAQVAKRPFSVVLLDELEKAHPNVLNALLQMLDEGVLRDNANRPISFRDAVIIATSNAGAAEIQTALTAGGDPDIVEEGIVHTLIANGTFRPEFLNRFDEVVVFRSLSEDDLLQVVDRIIAGINNNLVSQSIAVAVTDEAKLWLVNKGNDPMLGARPMRRIVQRTVESLIARRMLEAGGVAPGSTIQIQLDDVQSL